METLFPVLIGVAALFYILMPLLGDSSPFASRAKDEQLVSRAQIELDADLGKIDESERENLEAQLPPEAPRETVSVESLIRGARAAKRVDIELESEVLIARARRRHLN